jgi:hypothetical protein
MAANLTSYGGLLNGTLSWLGRDSTGEAIITPRFDDILLMAERRIYYGYATEDVGNPLRSDPLRIPEMEVVDPAFLMTGDSEVVRVDEAGAFVRVTEAAADTTDITITETLAGTVGQPEGFLELISARNNSDDLPISIVAQRVIDGFGRGAMGRVGLMAVSGMNFRFLDAPSDSSTATLRYFHKLETPAGSTSNDILDNYPEVYLYACLIEASIMTQDEGGSTRYLAMYSTSVQGLNARAQRITASTVPVMRLRAGLAP